MTIEFDTRSESQRHADAATPDDFEFAIVEIFGHRRHVGKAREEERFGAKMLRIDVPTLGPADGEVTWATHYYGGSSIFSYTLTDEKTVMHWAQRKTATPALVFRDHGPEDDDDGFDVEDIDHDAIGNMRSAYDE